MAPLAAPLLPEGAPASPDPADQGQVFSLGPPAVVPSAAPQVTAGDAAAETCTAPPLPDDPEETAVSEEQPALFWGAESWMRAMLPQAAAPEEGAPGTAPDAVGVTTAIGAPPGAAAVAQPVPSAGPESGGQESGGQESGGGDAGLPAVPPAGAPAMDEGESRLADGPAAGPPPETAPDAAPDGGIEDGGIEDGGIELAKDPASAPLSQPDLPADLPSDPAAEGAVPRPMADHVPMRAEGAGTPTPHPPAVLQVAEVALHAGEGTTELALSPEELGPVRIGLAGEGDSVTLTITAERPETLDLLRRNAAQLVAEMRSAGYLSVDLNFGQWTPREDPPDKGAAVALPLADPPPVPLPGARLAPAGAGLFLRI